MDAIIENLNRSNLIASIFVVVTVGLILHALYKIYTSLTSRPGVNKGEKVPPYRSLTALSGLF